MSRVAYKLHRTLDSPAVADPVPSSEAGAAADPPDDSESDPYYYGWRDHWETAPDGTQKWRPIPLTYRDLLDPQEGDFIAEDTVHRSVIEDVAGILRRRCADEPATAVWSNLKIVFKIPGLTTGPGPDICVVEGVEDRDRQRRSFRFGEEPGKVRLVVEVVSAKSLKKDTQDLLEIYEGLEVEEYVAIRPLGLYADGPFELMGWRRDEPSGRLCRFEPDREGRLHLRTMGLLLGTGADDMGLLVWDAATGERLRTAAEEGARQAEARRAAEEARRAAEEARRAAEDRAEREAAARREAEQQKDEAEQQKDEAEQQKDEAEQRNRELVAEIERLRARPVQTDPGRPSTA